MSWLDTLKSQTWFNNVASEFAQLAPHVPTAVWEGEILSEDASLDPAQQDYKKSGHWGLFQESTAFPTTVGLPAATVAQLQSPEYNAYIAALAMEKALKSAGTSDTTAQIQALERAGWPGAVSDVETSTRVANVNQIIAAGGGSPSSTPTSRGPWWDPMNGPLNPFGNSYPSNQQAVNNSDLSKSIASGVQSLETNLLVGGIIVGVLTGGFLLLGNSMSDGHGTQLPVPVPV